MQWLSSNFWAQAGLRLKKTWLSSLEIIKHVALKNHSCTFIRYRALSGLLDYWARAFSGNEFMQCRPSIETGLTVSGLGSFQLHPKLLIVWKLLGFRSLKLQSLKNFWVKFFLDCVSAVGRTEPVVLWRASLFFISELFLEGLTG